MKNMDPRAIRSRQYMQEAFFELLEDKPFEKISITDITDLAGLSRPTFYLHYKVKEDIIIDYFYESSREVFDEYIHLWMQGIYDQPIISALIDFFRVTEKNRKLLEIIFQTNQHYLIYENFKSYQLEYLHQMEKKYKMEHSQTTLRLLAQFSAGATTALLTEWIENPLDVSAEQMGEASVKMVQQILKPVMHENLLEEIFRKES